ncbi:jg4167, partial [Pararge aegeria aegeria]
SHGGSSSSVTQQQTETQTEAPVKANFSKKRFNTATRETKAEDAPAPAASKPSRGRFGRLKSHGGSSSSVTQQQTETQTEAPVKANFSKKRFNTATRETKAEDAPAPAASKPSRGRFGRRTYTFMSS